MQTVGRKLMKACCASCAFGVIDEGEIQFLSEKWVKLYFTYSKKNKIRVWRPIFLIPYQFPQAIIGNMVILCYILFCKYHCILGGYPLCNGFISHFINLWYYFKCIHFWSTTLLTNLHLKLFVIINNIRFKNT